jgi:hypothetical protein
MDPYNPQEQPEDIFDALAEQLLVCTGAVSLIVGGMYEDVGTGRLAPGVDVRQSAHELFSGLLAEHLAPHHSDYELAVAASVLYQAIETICEHMNPVPTGTFGCEGRRRSGGLGFGRLGPQSDHGDLP